MPDREPHLHSRASALAAGFKKPFDLGGGEPLPHKGKYDVYVVKLDPDGKHLFSRTIGGPQSDQCDVAHIEPGGSVLMGCFVDAKYNQSSVTYPVGGTLLLRHVE